MNITEKNLAKELRDAVEGRTYITETSTEEDWQYAARRAAELLDVELAPEPKPLPTEPGSVIIATEVRGVTGEWRMMLDRDGDWYTVEEIADRQWHHPKLITKWTEARVVPATATATATPVTLTEDQAAEFHEAARLKDPAGAGVMPFNRLPEAVRAIHTAAMNAALAQYVAPAEGELIDPKDVRKGGRVRLVLNSGDVVTIKVVDVGVSWITSHQNTYLKRDIAAVYLLPREE